MYEIKVYRCSRCGDLVEECQKYPLYEFTCECGGTLKHDPYTTPLYREQGNYSDQTMENESC